MGRSARARLGAALFGVVPLAALGAACSRAPHPAPAAGAARPAAAADLPSTGAAQAPAAAPTDPGKPGAQPAASAEATALPEGAIDAAVAAAIAAQALPGAVVVVGRRDRVLFRRAYGHREVVPELVPMTLDTVFDLASLTKPIATATSVMALAERGAIGLDDPLAKYVPACSRPDKSAITLRQLLLHVAGLPADIAKEEFSHGRDAAIRRICGVTLRAAPGASSTYSDLGFVLLEEVVRRVTSQELSAFAEQAIFSPLAMRDTRFQPTEAQRQRAAWTELVDGEWRVGVVHDPRAYLLGGVAGHAGLFSTADDLAVYARAILGGGEVDGKRILSPRTVAAMIAPHDVPGGVRALGWAIDSAWRGVGLSPSAIGHFGFTGTALWIDPDKDLFTIVLTNRVHPDGKGDSKPLVSRINTLAAQAVGPAAGRVDACSDVAEDVRTGIDVLRDERFERLRGRRVGLITNASGRARDGTSTVDLLARAPGVNLVALFTPEHGIDAQHEGSVPDGHDARTGLPVYSLYGDALAPTSDSLAGLDTLVFDIQDAGTRFFTYASTMQRAMLAARDHGLRFVVLDRPNPIDGVDVAGPVLVPASRSFVNYHSLPIRHGMTMGELATMLNADDHLGVALSVVPMRGWHRSAYWDDTGLAWVNPSPNLRSVTEALLYPAVGLLESTNLSVGRGTDAPFEHLGAPWIDAGALAAAVAADALPGVAFAPEAFTPAADRFAGQPCGGVRVTVLDRAQFEPVRTGLAIARELRRLYPRQWEFDKLDRLLVHPQTMRALDAALPLASIVDTYRLELAAFAAKREKYLLYGTRRCADLAR
ncbi:MAG TPA: exo-beta-N-acetylmuramidase NamZ domain-containing protein [Polyangiaceae bacterium]|nr:exo-beta-N-acetylmuramidase NamZ domain-containing protein [Polyangiaceae bacterium]